MHDVDLGPLGRAYVPHLPAGSLAVGDPRLLEESLAALLCRAQADRPGIVLSPEVFLRHVAERTDGDPLSALAALHAGDLYLACACAHGDPRALAAFDAGFLAQVPALLSRERLSQAALDEVCQQLRARYLVACPSSPPRIVEYSGRGKLIGWVRVASLHLALNLFRNKDEQLGHKEATDSALLSEAAEDPELDYIRRRYQPEFKAAFQATVAALEEEERELLRMNAVRGLSIDKIAPLYGISRATAARRLAAARQAILDGTLQRLKAQLQLSQAEVESLIRVLRSEIHLSIARCLQTA